jgi:hypothetical protein
MTIELGPAAATETADGARRPARMTGSLVVACALALLSGCGEHDEPRGLTKQAVAFDDVPAPLRDAAGKNVPGVKFNEAWKNLDRDGKVHSYEIRGRNPADGKIREVRVSLTGEILESE